MKLIIPLNWLVGWAVALWWRLQMLAPGVMASWQSVHWWTLWKDEGMRREKMEYAAKRDAAIYEKQIEDLQRGAEGIIAERDEALRRLAETKAAP